MRVGLATLQRGRHRHLARQVRGVLDGWARPDRWVVASMDEDATTTARLLDVAGGAPAGRPRLVHRPVPDGAPLPLAAARNAAIAALGDVDLAVLLDVDCVPGPGLLARYAAAHAAVADTPDADATSRSPHGRAGRLLAGPVAHLPAGVPAVGDALDDADRRSGRPSPARPVPDDDVVLPEDRYERFWSLSFAVSPATHARIGGFDEAYVGYGGEDTDYALRARAAGVELAWVGGAWAYHQHHAVSSPPYEHLAAIVRNAHVFRARWDRWPMEGWLRAFAADGLVEWEPDGAILATTPAGATTIGAPSPPP